MVMAEEKTNWLTSTKEYVGELRNEMRKVSWPSRKQVQGTTAVVIFAVFAFGAYFEVVDTVLTRVIKSVLTYFSK